MWWLGYTWCSMTSHAAESATELANPNLGFCSSMYAIARNAFALLSATDWSILPDQFSQLPKDEQGDDD